MTGCAQFVIVLPVRVFVSSYSIRVREKRDKEWLPFGFEEGSSLHETVYRTMELLRSHHRHQESQRLIRSNRLNQDDTDILGILERGEFGISARGVNHETFAPTYRRKVADAELIPLYFRFHLPVDSTVGILIMQRLGVHGAFGHLSKFLQEKFREFHGNHLLKIGRFVPSSVLKALSEGEVREMSIFEHTISRDIADRMRLRGTEINVGTVEIRIRAKRNDILWDHTPRWANRLRTEKVTIAEFFGDDVSRVKLRVKYKGQERMYDFSGHEGLAPYIDVTDDVEMSGGHPVFDSIDEYSCNLRDELIEQLGREPGA